MAKSKKQPVCTLDSEWPNWTPQDYIRMRIESGFSQKKLSLLLDLGPNEWGRFERGLKKPTTIYGRYIQFCFQPDTWACLTRDIKKK